MRALASSFVFVRLCACVSAEVCACVRECILCVKVTCIVCDVLCVYLCVCVCARARVCRWGCVYAHTHVVEPKRQLAAVTGRTQLQSHFQTEHTSFHVPHLRPVSSLVYF